MYHPVPFESYDVVAVIYTFRLIGEHTQNQETTCAPIESKTHTSQIIIWKTPPFPSLMVVKDKVGRKRYIGFEIHIEGKSHFHRGAVIRALNQESGVARKLNPWLTEFDGMKGIVRCPHTEKDAIIELLRNLKHIDRTPVSVKTVTTSGCIKTVKEKLRLVSAPREKQTAKMTGERKK